MLPLPSTSRAEDRAGFTLIELLIVIAIIAVLAGILLAVFGGVRNQAGKVQAVNDIRSTKVAVTAYYTDYQKYPLNQAQSDAGTLYNLGDTVYGDPGGQYSSADLFDILRAVPDGNKNPGNLLNPNQTVYWSGGFAKSATKPRGGITTQDVTVASKPIPKGSLVDPWGNSYLIYFDADRDGDLSLIIGHFYNNMPVGTVAPGRPPLGVAISSMGPDGKFGTNGNGNLPGSDDIVSW